jgi:glycerol kinase
MQKEAHLKATEHKVDGGACANNFLMQFQANLNQQKVLRPKIIETTSLGAAYLAGLGVGFWKNPVELKKHWQLDQKFSPKISRTQRSQQIDEWKTAVKRVL